MQPTPLPHRQPSRSPSPTNFNVPAKDRIWLCRKDWAVGGNLHPVAIARYIETIERADRVLGLAVNRAKGGEVVPADQSLRRFMHGVGIERFGDPERPVSFQRQGRTPVDDAVKIMTACG